MLVKPFLLITSREDDSVVLPEVASYQHLTGLTDDEMEWIRAEEAPLRDLDLDRYSGIILAGSPFTVSAPEHQKTEVERRVERDLSRLLDRVIEADKPFLGICYGVGTIGRHQGAKIGFEYGEQTQAVAVSVTAAGRIDPLFSELPATFDAYVGHKEAVTSVPDHFTVLATSASCPVQAFRVKQHVYATQFHPELQRDSIIGRIRAYARHGYFEVSRLDDLIAEVERADVRASHMVLSRFIERYARTDTADALAGGKAATLDVAS